MFAILHIICFGDDNAFGEMFPLFSELVSPSEVVQAYIIIRNEIIVCHTSRSLSVLSVVSPE